MNRRLKKKLAVAVAVAAVLAGGAAAALAATHSAAQRSGRRGPLVAAANYLGVSPTQLRDELRSGKSLAEIADATKDRSATGLIQALEATEKDKLTAAAADLPARVTAEVDRVRGRGGLLRAAARYLGVSPAQLRSQLRSGKTMAQIAKATGGKSEAGLIEALVTARKAALAGAVKAGTITQARANEVQPELVARVTARVNRSRRPPGSRSRAGGHKRPSSASGGE